MRATAPLPPRELAERVGPLYGGDLVDYDAVGKRIRDEIVQLLPAGWTLEGKSALDFGCGAGRTLRHFLDDAENCMFYGCDIDAPSIEWLRSAMSPPFTVFVNQETPPLPLEPESLDLIWAISVFTHISDQWALWLAELHRLLKDDGLLVATFHGPAFSDEWAKAAPDPMAARGEPVSNVGGRIGMNVLHHSRTWDQGGPAVFLSAWWIEEHWGRGFEIIMLEEDGFVAAQPDWRGHGVVLASKRPVEISADELERIDPDDPREIEALRHNIRQLHAESRKHREAFIWLEREHEALTAQLTNR